MLNYVNEVGNDECDLDRNSGAKCDEDDCRDSKVLDVFDSVVLVDEELVYDRSKEIEDDRRADHGRATDLHQEDGLTLHSDAEPRSESCEKKCEKHNDSNSNEQI